MSKQLLLRGCAVTAALLSLYAVLAMFTQAMLGGHSAGQIWWDRLYAWWVDFLAAGLLALLAVYLWRRSQRAPGITSRRPGLAPRVILFPLGHVFLTACLYFGDFASYLRNSGNSGDQSFRATLYVGISVVCAAVSVATFWSAYKIRKSTIGTY
jgi:hypothetical protein